MATLSQYLLVQQRQPISTPNLLKKDKKPGKGRNHACRTLAERRSYRETFSAPILKPMIFLII